MFFRSLTPVEQDHTLEAFTFELGKVFDKEIKGRVLEVLADVDVDLCTRVANGARSSRPKRLSRSGQDGFGGAFPNRR